MLEAISSLHRLMVNRTTRLMIVASGLVWGFTLPATAHALTVRPAVLEVDTAPRTVVAVELTLANPDHIPVSVDFAAADIVFSQDGRMQLVDQPSGRSGYGFADSVELPERLIIGPQSTVTAPITFITPATIIETDGYGALILRPSATEMEEQDGHAINSVNVVSQIVVPLLLNGLQANQRAELVVDNFYLPRVHFFRELPISLTLKNEGNIHLEPYGRLDVTSYSPGQATHVQPLDEDIRYLFPDTQRTYRRTWQSPSWFPVQFVHFRLTASANKAQSTTHIRTVVLLPWQTFIPSIIALVVCSWLFVDRRQARRRQKRSSQ